MPPRLIVRAARTVAQRGPRGCAPLLCVFAALVCLAPVARARDTYARLAWLDALEYRIRLTIPEAVDEISAETEIDFEFRPDAPRELPRELPLDFGALDVDGVAVNGQPAKFRRAEGRLFVTLAENIRSRYPLTVSVKYHGRPADGLFFKRNKFGDRTVFADNWPNRAHHWFPSIDHPYDKAKVEFDVTAPARYDVIANGRMLETRSLQDGTRLTRWREDVEIPVYCMVVGATEFTVLDAGGWGGTRLSYYLYPKDRDKGLHDYGRALRAAEFFERLVGPYPYEKLALVESSTRFGGMENSSSIFFDENSYDGSGKLEGTVAHEIAHQWFGDSVTEADWHHLWLSEGFATYFGALFYEHADGHARFIQMMRDARERYMKDADAVSRPVIDPSVTDLFKLLNRNNYEKGAWVLHMLRRKIGDENFFRGISEYYRTRRNRNAMTEDLKSVMENYAGGTGSLDVFFKQWLYRPGYPVYDARWYWNDDAMQACMRIRQTQPGPPFDTDVDIELVTRGESRTAPMRVSERSRLLCFQTRYKPDAINIDPDDWLLKTATVREVSSSIDAEK